ncbi:unnamed protein product [Hermetia illucens]|uniref:S1 motif domain-containing protein n=1 Tax=Hermetia illucens TaxID=343691 RepID=A0A7R8YTY5_HERIL|nr:unnamed protein product [Hermetia illucens]
MNSDLIVKSLCFHGQPLQKIWEGERGNHDLPRLGIANPDYSVYMARQKNLTFQDRAKRLKLHQFVARNASILFDSKLIEDMPSAKRREKPNAFPVVMPPYEAFLSKSIDKSKHVAEILEVIQPGDIIYGMVLSRTAYGVVVKVLCTGEPVFRYLADITIKAYVVTQNLVPAYDKKGNPKTYNANDYVCCEVLDVSADADRMVLGMKGALTIDAKAPLGLITAEQMPEYYKMFTANDEATVEDLLGKSKAFQNPNCVDLLFQESGLDPNEIYSNIPALKNRFPQQEYATELRQIQASKWAFRSVADGIEHFKVGRHSEAFQCLNKALSIDPRNVEGLVARGALYANSGSFKKAVDDFETALKLNPYHANARKYMGETLVALGRSYEEESRVDEARKAYMDCLNIIPHHEDAKSSLDFLNSKTGQGKQLIDANELALPGTIIKKEVESKKDRSSKKKNKSRKRKDSSSTSSSNDSSDSESNSSESSTTSDSSSSSTDSESSEDPSFKSKKKNHSRKKSLSPLSKRMALMDEQHPQSCTTRYQFNQPFHLANTSSASGQDDYDSKVRNFLNMTNEDEDYESRVRKLIEEASKHKKDRKNDEKSKKKDKKKQKKMKKENKKEKRRKEKSKNNSDLSQLENMELKEALKILKTLPVPGSGGKSIQDDLEECQKYEQIVDLLQKRREQSITSKEQQSTSKLVGKSGPYSSFERNIERDSSFNSNQQQSQLSASKPQSPPPPPPVKKPTTPPPPPPISIDRPRLPAPIQLAPAKPPVVLDKFGSFRLAAFDDSKDLPNPVRGLDIDVDLDHRADLYRVQGGGRDLLGGHGRPDVRFRDVDLVQDLFIDHDLDPSGGLVLDVVLILDIVHILGLTDVDLVEHQSPIDDRRGGRRRGMSYRGSRGFGRGFRGGRGRGRRGGFRGGRRSPFFRPGRRGSFDDRESHQRDDRSSGDEDSYKRKGRNRDKDKDGIDGKWAHDKYEKSKPIDAAEEEENWDDNPSKVDAIDETVEEIDKKIDQAQKERKEEILQRDKDLLKKPTPNNLPF